MKQLTKEQLTEMVNTSMAGVYRSNQEKLMKSIYDLDKDTDTPCLVAVKAMAIIGAEIIQECSQALVETLYNVLYTE